MNGRELLFYTYERNGLTYVNPLPARQSACRWWDMLAKMGRCIDRILSLLLEVLHGRTPGSR